MYQRKKVRKKKVEALGTMEELIAMRERELALAMQNRGKWGMHKNIEVEKEIVRLKQEIADLRNEEFMTPIDIVKREMARR